LVAVVIIVGAAVGWILLSGRRAKVARAQIEQWANANGLAVVNVQRRLMDRGPFFWNTSQFQGVYYVLVRDPAGQTRALWVRSGRYWGGASETIDIHWA
ncbi:MAG TPA: hypothetical protein VD886_15335, partial [Herpetosiphonaceae bacterium]|nr:hypothetical protein [Herpetosiphonaceae bacterium]